MNTDTLIEQALERVYAKIDLSVKLALMFSRYDIKGTVAPINLWDTDKLKIEKPYEPIEIKKGVLYNGKFIPLESYDGDK